LPKVTTLQETSSGTTRGDRPAPSRLALPFRPHVIGAVFQRNFFSYFSNPAGYVFITLFVAVSAWVAFSQRIFFSNNLANLDILNSWMPILLILFVPAITMSMWAEERRLGTDELLFTLPAHDVDVVLGKYLAALGIYTVALVFSLTHVLILAWLGNPDFGVLFSTYLGYWLMGAMLLAVGMVASAISTNVTVAFILGALFVAVPVGLGRLGSPSGTWLRRQFEDLSVPAQFHDFGTGVIPLSGVVYFLSFAVAMLYVNMVLLGRRHWAGGQRSGTRWIHAVVRVLSVFLALASFDALVTRLGWRKDLTAERLHTISRETLSLLRQIPRDKPVLIQAYYSPEVPGEYVETKADLLGLLKEYAAKGGDRIRLNLVETELYSPAARDAEKRFGIEARRVPSIDEAKQSLSEIFLGVAFTSGVEEVVIPFFDRGLPVEYELTRSIRTVSRSGRKKVGILGTDAKLMGGFDFRAMGSNPEWSIVTELKKQYDVSSVAADSPIPTNLDALLVAQPSSLTQKQIDNLTAFVRGGGATLLFLDPLPIENIQIAPEVPKQPPGGPFGGGPPPEPKGDLRPLLDLLGIDWPTTEIVWNEWNPLKQLELPPEVVFIGPGSGEEDAFNKEQILSSGLQEVVMIFAGHLRSKGGGPEFTPLLRTSRQGGVVDFKDATQQSFFGVTLADPRTVRHFASDRSYIVAARIQGKPAAPEAPRDPAKKEEKKEPEKPAEVRAIAIADLDLISEQFFDLRRQKRENLELDNVTFVLNSIDVLAGDEAFIPLRKRREVHRTLQRLEKQTEAYIKIREAETKAAEQAAEEQRNLAQKRFDKEVEAVQARTDLDAQDKRIKLSSLREVANRRLEVEKANIDDQKRKKIQESKADTEQHVRKIQNGIRTVAILLPPLPAVILGLIVFGVRVRRENLGANPNRLV
jgi:ABC-2 type transport system permease protein